MQDAVTFVVAALCDLYVVTFVLRLAMALGRSDTRNPLAQFILRVTNPLVLPARRFIPAIGRLDTATLVVLLVLQSLATGVLANLACVGATEVGQIVLFALLRLVHLVLRTYSLLTLIYVITSWVASGGYNPALALLAAIVEPILAPLRRFIPPIGGLDLSPLVALLAIEFLNRLVPGGAALAGLVCAPF